MSSLTGQERNGWLKGRTVEVELLQTHVVQGTLGVTQSSGKRVMIRGQPGLGSKTLPTKANTLKCQSLAIPPFRPGVCVF